MKKKLSLIMAIAIAASMLPGFMVSHAAFTTVTENYENVSTNVVNVGGEHGNVLVQTTDGQMTSIFPGGMGAAIDTTGGNVYTVSFDMKVDGTAHGNIIFALGSFDIAMQLSPTELLTSNWNSTGGNYYFGGNPVSPAVTGTFTEWNHFDIVRNVVTGSTQIYINGDLKRDFTAECYTWEGQSSPYGIADVFLSTANFNQYDTSNHRTGNVYVDNASVASYAGGISATLNQASKTFTVNVPAGTAVNAGDVGIYFGGEKVAANVVSKTATSFVLQAEDDLATGTYQAKVNVAGLIPNQVSFNVVAAGGTSSEPAGPGTGSVMGFANKFFDFEETSPVGDSAYNSWSYAADPTNSGRGQVLQATATGAMLLYPFGETVWASKTNGEYYLYSLDVYIPDDQDTHTAGEYILLNMYYGPTGNWQPVVAYQAGTLYGALGWGIDANQPLQSITSGWHRIDMLFTQNTVPANGYNSLTVWVDGANPRSCYLGTIDGANHSPVTHFAIFDQLGADSGRIMIDNAVLKRIDTVGTAVYKSKASFDLATGTIIVESDEILIEASNISITVNGAPAAVSVSQPLPTKAVLTPIIPFQNGDTVVVNLEGCHSGVSYHGTDTPFHTIKVNGIGGVTLAEVGAVKVYGADGTANDVASAPVVAKKITAELPYGVLAGTTPVITLTGSNGAVDISAVSYNAATKIATVTVNEVLDPTANYTLAITATAADNTQYVAYSETVTTGTFDGFYFGGFEVVDDGAEVTLYYDVVNYGANAVEGDLIIAGYTADGRLKGVEIESSSFASGDALYDEYIPFGASSIVGSDYFVIYLWNGIGTMVPVTVPAIR